MAKLFKLNTKWQYGVTIYSFVFFTLWWLFLQVVTPGESSNHRLFGALYGVIALLGGIFGMDVARRWGGVQSIIGKSILMFSLGLLAQEFGQIVYSYNHYFLNKEGMYPSLGDLGYFGSIPLYIYGVYLLGKASGVKVGLVSFERKLQAVIIPLIILVAGYVLFLEEYKFDWSQPIKTFLDFGYPLGQAIYVSLAILVYLLSRGILGGIMKKAILFILFALCFQFLADYTFLYQSSKGTWHVGEINDYMYLVAYFVMTLALLQFNIVLKRLREKK